MYGGDDAPRIRFDATLQSDFENLLRIDSLGLRLRSPKTYLVGDNEVWDAFRELVNLRVNDEQLPEHLMAIVDRALNCCRSFVLPKGTRFYRIRKNPHNPAQAAAYDSPPLGSGSSSRFSKGLASIMYGAFDVETCIHESRCRIDDEICIATVETMTDLTTIDLGDAPYQAGEETPWTSPSVFLGQVMRSSRHDECQIIGERVFERGIAALQFPSFFSQVLDQRHANIAIVGHPIAEGKARIHSLNRIKLERARYEYAFGPIFELGGEA